MKLKLLLFLSLIILLLNACKKSNTNKPGSEANITYPRTLYRTAITVKTGLRVFTKDGEITDPSIKNRILGDSTSRLGFFPFTYSPQPDDTLLINFINADTAIINHSKYKQYVSQSNGQLLMSSIPIHNNGLFDNYFFLISDLTKFKTYTIDATGYTAPLITVGYGDHSNLNVPTFYFSIKNNTYGPSIRGRSRGEFNEQAISKLGANDTLAVKEYNYVMQVK